MQCPDYHDLRVQLFDSINALEGEIPLRFKEGPDMVFRWLMGHSIEGVNALKLWTISGTSVFKMYCKAIRNRDGIGKTTILTA